ncbi:MAG: tail fiber domain-containing protein [Rhizomicrobium sp.]
MRRGIVFAFLVYACGACASTAQAASCPAPPTLANGQTANANDILGVFSCINGNFAPLTGPSFTGNVGIGTASPSATLTIQGAGTGSGVNFQTTNASHTPLITAVDNGNVSIGAPGASSRLSIGVATDNTGVFDLQDRSVNSVVFGATANSTSIAGLAVKNLVWGSSSSGSDMVFGPSTAATTALVLKANGNIGIGTTSPAVSLDVVGTIRQSGCVTAGTLAVNGSGDIICSSDARLKNVLGDYAGGLAAVVHLSPKLFTYRPTRGDPNETFVHAGFLAQDVMSVIPQASALQRDGYYSLDTTAILAATVNAVKELKAIADKQAKEITVLKAKLVEADRRLTDAHLKQASAIEELRVEIAEIRHASQLKTASR